MTPCISQPVSWYKLERMRMGQLAQVERANVEAHLAACPCCSGAYARTAEPRELRSLDTPRVSSPAVRAAFAASGAAQSPSLSERIREQLTRLQRELWIGSALAATAVALLVVLRTADGPGGPGTGPGLEPPARVHVKGGELALQLVRSTNAGLAQPSHFAAGDHFKVQITCPPGFEGHVDTVVYQDDQAFFPLAAGRVQTCANGVVLPGAFSLSGKHAAVVCVVFGTTREVDRDALQVIESPLPEHSVCERVLPAE